MKKIFKILTILISVIILIFILLRLTGFLNFDWTTREGSNCSTPSKGIKINNLVILQTWGDKPWDPIPGGPCTEGKSPKYLEYEIRKFLKK